MGNNGKLLYQKENYEIYDNDIDLAIDTACKALNIQNLVNENQTRWKAVLTYAGQMLFPDRDILKDHTKPLYYTGRYYLDCNRYDIEMLLALCDYYIFLSYKFNKVISIIGFSLLANIDYRLVYGWNTYYNNNIDNINNNSIVSVRGYEIYRRLTYQREDNLKDKAIDNGNVMGIFQVGRREYQWDMPGVREATFTPALGAADLPRLDKPQDVVYDDDKTQDID